MGIIESVSNFVSQLQKHNINYAIIGGLAVFAYGGERTTFDIDFLIHGDQFDKVKKMALDLGLSIVNENREVLQFSGPVQIDVIFANRPLSRAMLTRTQMIGQLPYPVVAPEDLIGLKIQAYKGDSKREFIDKGDILTLFRNVSDLDFKKIKEYADIFNAWKEIEELKKHI